MTPDERHQAALTDTRYAQHSAWRRGHWHTAQAHAGRIRILNRHQPVGGANTAIGCTGCWRAWPCPDWLDAAAESDPKEPTQ